MLWRGIFCPPLALYILIGLDEMCKKVLKSYGLSTKLNVISSVYESAKGSSAHCKLDGRWVQTRKSEP